LKNHCGNYLPLIKDKDNRIDVWKKKMAMEHVCADLYAAFVASLMFEFGGRCEEVFENSVTFRCEEVMIRNFCDGKSN
jgi:hypothetical protein